MKIPFICNVGYSDKNKILGLVQLLSCGQCTELGSCHKLSAGSVLFLEVDQTLYLSVKPNESLQGVYYLGRSLEGLVVKEGTAQAVVTEGRRIQCDQVNLHVTGVM